MISWRYCLIACFFNLSLLSEPVRVKIPYKELIAVNFALGSDFACSEVQLLVQEIQKELGMADYKIEVRKFSEKGLKSKTSGMAVLTTHVFFDEQALLKMSCEEQRFLIGHELVHIRSNHRRKQIMLNNIISYGGTALSIFGAVLLWRSMLSAKQWVFDDAVFLKNSHATFKDFYKQTNAFTEDQAFGFSVAAYGIGSFASFLLGLCCEQALSRSHEEEADCYAAHELQCALGGCLFFLKSMLKNGNFSSESGVFDTHPTSLKRFMNLMMISGDTILSDLVTERGDKAVDIYFQDILDYLEEQVA